MVCVQLVELDRDQRGALVIEITGGSPAEEAGLRGSDTPVHLDGEQAEVGGDVIVAIDDQPVVEFDDPVGSMSVGDEVTLTIVRDGREQMEELRAIVLEATPGQQVTLTMTRDGEELTLEVTLGERPATNPCARSNHSLVCCLPGLVPAADGGIMRRFLLE